ncbi:hypothetical protein CRG98_006055 [Punica granatum]|uniref:Uncharacterized protein n=1 Tax=Punica granatum TaxID=22663 RepID=A0A2I0KYD0_PUNGR|nr:hypothetical protein CRG98_006055 [Punica granatum]
MRGNTGISHPERTAGDLRGSVNVVGCGVWYGLLQSTIGSSETERLPPDTTFDRCDPATWIARSTWRDHGGDTAHRHGAVRSRRVLVGSKWNLGSRTREDYYI